MSGCLLDLGLQSLLSRRLHDHSLYFGACTVILASAGIQCHLGTFTVVALAFVLENAQQRVYERPVHLATNTPVLELEDLVGILAPAVDIQCSFSFHSSWHRKTFSVAATTPRMSNVHNLPVYIYFAELVHYDAKIVAVFRK